MTQLTMRARDLFDLLGGEQEQPQRRPEVRVNSTLEMIVEKFEKLLARPLTYNYNHQKGFEVGFYDDSFRTLSQALRSRISARDVEQFSLMLGQYRSNDSRLDEQKGLFISALIAASPAQDFTVHTARFNNPIDYIGYCNTKNIVVNGDVNDVGSGISAGTILIKGNAKSICRRLGEIRGAIEIQGDVGTKEVRVPLGFIYAGNGIVRIHGNVYGGIYDNGEKRARIRVHGDVHGPIRLCGYGEVHLDGEYEKIILDRNIDYHPFKIFHKGKLVVHGHKVNVPEDKLKWEH